MKITEIFLSIDGEGVRTGLPTVFIRSYGCNLRCSYCDTTYSYNGNDYIEMTVDQIIKEVGKYGCKSVTFTGGEPLIQEDAAELLEKLVKEGYNVNVETNGTIVPPVLDDNIIYTVDYKTPSSGMNYMMNADVFGALTEKDVIKFVVSTTNEMDLCYNVFRFNKAKKYFSPVFGCIEPKDIVQHVLENNWFDCIVQVQLHKIIWHPDERGV